MKYGFEMFEYNYRECEHIHSFISPESVIRSVCEDYIGDCTDCPFGKDPNQRCAHIVENADFWKMAEHFLTIVNGDYGCHLIMMYYKDDRHEGRIEFAEKGIIPHVWDDPFVADPVEDLDFIFKKDLEFFNENMELPEVFYRVTNEISYDINYLKKLEGLPIEGKKEEKEIKAEEKETTEIANRTFYEWKAGPYPSETESSGDYVIFYGVSDGEGGFDTARAFVHWDAASERWEEINPNWIVFAILRVPKNPKIIFEMEG